MVTSPQFVPQHIIVNGGDGHFYKSLMEKARISPIIIQHMVEMVDGSDCKKTREEMFAASTMTFQNIANDRHFDKYGQPLRAEIPEQIIDLI
jgi:hypothetical protein